MGSGLQESSLAEESKNLAPARADFLAMKLKTLPQRLLEESRRFVIEPSGMRLKKTAPASEEADAGGLVGGGEEMNETDS